MADVGDVRPSGSTTATRATCAARRTPSCSGCWRGRCAEAWSPWISEALLLVRLYGVDEQG